MLSDCKILPILTHTDERGSLGVVETDDPLPFSPQRLYFLYGVPEQKSRGEHAHRVLRQFIFAVSGSLSITLDDGHDQKRYVLDNPKEGLYIAPMVWRKLEDFSPDAICCVLASEVFQPSDYVHDYRDFLDLVRA